MINYFSHDSNARNSDKLLPVRMKLGAEGYGIYFMILERLREEPDYTSVKDYTMIAFDLRVDVEKVKSVIEDFDLFIFTEDRERFYSNGFKKRMEFKDSKSKVLSEAGKKGAKKRWDKAKEETKQKGSYSHPINDPLRSDSKISKEKKRKVEESKASSDDEDENPIRLFEDNIGNLSPIQMQDLLQWQDELGKELTMFAVSHAAMKSAKYYGFVQNLFKDWSSHNIDTVEKAKNYENQKQPSYKQKEERSSEYEYIRENNDPGW